MWSGYEDDGWCVCSAAPAAVIAKIFTAAVTMSSHYPFCNLFTLEYMKSDKSNDINVTIRLYLLL